MGGAVRPHQPVDAELCVVAGVAEVPAVAPEDGGATVRPRRRGEEALVHPVPDEAALRHGTDQGCLSSQAGRPDCAASEAAAAAGGGAGERVAVWRQPACCCWGCAGARETSSADLLQGWQVGPADGMQCDQAGIHAQNTGVILRFRPACRVSAQSLEGLRPGGGNKGGGGGIAPE